MSYEPDLTDPVRPPRGSRIVEGVLAALLAMSLVGNVVQYRRPPPRGRAPGAARRGGSADGADVRRSARRALVPSPPPPPCPTVATGAVTGAGHGPPPPREDLALAQQGEGHIATAAEHGERDPVHRAAQRNVVTGLDNIVTSRSAPAAERFLQRTLPSVASMDCAFRDPAMAEHVRMQLRPLNALARPQARLSEADLVRYERDLRCPRE